MHNPNALTIGELRAALLGLPDDLSVLVILGDNDAAWLARVRYDDSGFLDLLAGPHALDKIDDSHHAHTVAEIGNVPAPDDLIRAAITVLDSRTEATRAAASHRRQRESLADALADHADPDLGCPGDRDGRACLSVKAAREILVGGR